MHNGDSDEFGKFFENVRKKIARGGKLTRKGLAERLGIAPSTVGDWEQSRAVPETATFKALLKLADLKLQDCFYLPEDVSRYRAVEVAIDRMNSPPEKTGSK